MGSRMRSCDLSASPPVLVSYRHAAPHIRPYLTGRARREGTLRWQGLSTGVQRAQERRQRPGGSRPDPRRPGPRTRRNLPAP